jgi:hypothetical protein
MISLLFDPKITDRTLSSQAMTPGSGVTLNSDSYPIGNFRFDPDV